MSKVEVAKSAQIHEGEIHLASAGGHSIALTRITGTVRAFENKCPHLGLSLARGKIENGTITCPWHGSRYDICSGKNLDWVNSIVGIPMPQWSHGLIALGKSPAPVRTFDVSEGNGAVFVDL